MSKEREILNDFMVSCFYSILEQEEKALLPVFGNKLSLKEIHLISTVYDLQKIGNNNFSRVANKLGVTLGTLTASFSKLEKKGYLKKEKYLIDNRVFYITPTKLADKVHKEHQDWHTSLLDGIIRTLPQNDLENLTKSLEQLSTFIKNLKST